MEELNLFRARSTWVAIFTAIANVIFLVTGEIPFAVEEATNTTLLAIDGLAALWIYIERVTGKMKLVMPWSL